MNKLLLALVLLPALGAGLVFLLPSKAAKWWSLSLSLVGVVLGAVLWCQFDSTHASEMQFSLAYPWIEYFRAQFALGVDGLSLPLVVLTKFMMPIALLASWKEERRPKLFQAAFLILDAAMTGTFLATDMFLFYVFWEIMLIPMLLIIGIWGSHERVYAAIKFFLYTFAGSLLMLVAIFCLMVAHQEQMGYPTGNIASLYGLSLGTEPLFWGLGAQQLIFLAFTLAFAIKVPLFPLHTWLPDAHVQAPTGGSILLAAVLLKMGTYGLLRFSIPIAPVAFAEFTPLLAGLAIVGIMYGAWVAFQQTDMKKLVAYSSVSHLGFVVLGICATNGEGWHGAMLQMVNHGLSTGALFFLVGVLYERRHTRDFADYGGLAAVVPWFAFFMVFVSCSSMAVPGLNGFVGEFLILQGTFKANAAWAALTVLAVVFGALYMLLMVRQVLFGGDPSAENRMLKDLSFREWAGLVPLCIFIVILGVKPSLLMKKYDGFYAPYEAKYLKGAKPVEKASADKKGSRS